MRQKEKKWYSRPQLADQGYTEMGYAVFHQLNGSEDIIVLSSTRMSTPEIRISDFVGLSIGLYAIVESVVEADPHRVGFMHFVAARDTLTDELTDK